VGFVDMSNKILPVKVVLSAERTVEGTPVDSPIRIHWLNFVVRERILFLLLHISRLDQGLGHCFLHFLFLT
jgi:hypothetical protein